MAFDESRLPTSLYEARLQEVKKHMRRRRLDALIVAGKDITYLTGLVLSTVWFPNSEDYCFVTPDGRLVVEAGVGPRDVFFLKTQTWVKEVECPPNPIQEIVRLIGDKPGSRRIGVSCLSNSVRSHDFTLLKSGIGGKQLVQDESFFEALQAIKDPREVDVIGLACKSIDLMCESIRRNVSDGVSARQVEAKADRLARLEGAQDVRTLWAVGRKSSGALTPVDDGQFVKGDVISCYMSSEYQGYWSEAGRVFALGEPSRNYEAMYKTALRALTDAEEFVKPGVKVSEVVRRMLQTLKSSGYEGNFQEDYGFGHGIGLSKMEKPIMEPGNGTRLRENMVLSIRVPLYKEGRGEVLVGDTVRIAEGSAIRLTQSPLELQSIGP